MESETTTLITSLMSTSNETRQSAERQMKESRTNQAEVLLQALMNFIEQAGASSDQVKQQQASMAALLLKKQYLDDRVEEDGLWQLDKAQAIELKNKISSTINFTVQHKMLLNRKADIICKCYKKTENYDEMIGNLVTLL